MKLRQPVALVGLNRTPIGKMGGFLAGFEPQDLLAACFGVSKAGLFGASPGLISQFHRAYATEMMDEKLRKEDPGATHYERPSTRHEATHMVAEFEGLEASLTTPEEIIAGSVRNGTGNIARVAGLAAGFPQDVPAMTIDRQCASSMEALATACAKLNSGMAERILVGGVESSSRAPWLYDRTARPYAYAAPAPHRIRMAPDDEHDLPMGETAEILADEYGIRRQEMDAYAVKSHTRAAEVALAVWQKEYGDTYRWLFEEEKDIQTLDIPKDECIRPDTTVAKLSKLRPAFRPDGTVTAGNSSPLNDGAASCYALSREFASKQNLVVDAWVTGVATVALDPRRMGMGPAYAIPKLLKEHGLQMDDIDLFEINEAFAAQILAVLRQMRKDGYEVPLDRLNVHGGALALGHPMGATGIRLIVTLVNALKATGMRTGVASLCIGGGQGMAMLVETRL
ncbi:MAG: thiolase family protein [Sumerlaeia bacterium]